MNLSESDILKLRDSVKIDRRKAKAILTEFSQEVVTHTRAPRLLDNISSFFTMEGNGIGMSLKLIALVIGLGIFVFIGNQLGWYTANEGELAQVTVSPTPTATPTVSIIEDAKDVELVAEEIDKVIAEIDAMQTELDTLSLALSTSEIDSLGTELDGIK